MYIKIIYRYTNNKDNKSNWSEKKARATNRTRDNSIHKIVEKKIVENVVKIATYNF